MSVMKCVFSYFKKHIPIFLFSILVVTGVTFLSLVPPQLLKIIVDDVIPSKNLSNLMTFALLYMITFVLIGLVNFLKEILLVVVSQGVGKKIRLEMLYKINRMSYHIFSKYDSGELEAYFSNDVDEINTLITSGVISMLIDCLKIVGIVVSMFVLSWVFGLITLAIIPIIVAFTLWIRKRMYNAQILNRELEGNVNKLVLENIDNITTIKSYRIYDKIDKKYNNVLDNHFKTNQKVNNYDAMFSPIMQMLKNLVIVAIIVLSTINLDLFGISVGMLISSIDLITNLFAPIENLGMELQTIQKSLAAMDRINAFFKLEEDEIKSQDLDLKNDDFQLVFDDVSFSYDNEKVIEHFSYVMNKNDRLILKGKSGSGKSTIFKLAYGLIKPTSGRVTINGVDTYLLSNEAKRKLFGIVYQDYFFSGGTIKEEITMLDPSISEEKIYSTLALVGLDRIKDINEPLKVTDYSTGELSLFNIARAIILNSKILFLDEMNAKIDPISARHIIDVVNQVSKDKMVLSINHYGELLSSSKVINLER